jgi:hypothetical protein
MDRGGHSLRKAAPQAGKTRLRLTVRGTGVGTPNPTPCHKPAPHFSCDQNGLLRTLFCANGRLDPSSTLPVTRVVVCGCVRKAELVAQPERGWSDSSGRLPATRSGYSKEHGHFLPRDGCRGGLADSRHAKRMGLSEGRVPGRSARSRRPPQVSPVLAARVSRSSGERQPYRYSFAPARSTAPSGRHIVGTFKACVYWKN